MCGKKRREGTNPPVGEGQLGPRAACAERIEDAQLTGDVEDDKLYHTKLAGTLSQGWGEGALRFRNFTPH